MIKEVIKKYEERKRAMVNVFIILENEMVNMLSVMKNVDLNRVIFEYDILLEVDSGFSK